ncbi:MAG: ATP-binding cassette domain-containing protein [Deltaproteobacteria bacterium]|nr:ATP-binding cassette domain-containing protein [Deltaproteobacteria bacterium]
MAASSARALGLQSHLLRETPTHVPRDRPALIRVRPGQWLVVAGRKGRRLSVVCIDEHGETARTMTAAELADIANGEPWLQLQPRLALDAIAATRHPHLRDHPWLRLRAFLGLERRELGVIIIYAIVIGALTLATPVAVQALVNTVAFGSVLQPLVVLSLLLAAGLSFAGVLSVLEAYVVEVVQRRVFIRVADDFGRRIPSVRADALDDKHGAELVNRFFEVLTIQKSLAVLLLDGLSLTLQTVIGMVLLGFYHPLLLAFDVVLVVLLLVVLALGRGAVATGHRESSAKYRTVAWLEDLAHGSHLFRGSSTQQLAAQRTDTLCRDYITARKIHFRVLLRQITGGVGLQVVAMVSLLGVGGWLVIDRQLTLGQLVAAELVIAAIGAGFVKLGKNLEKLYDLNVGVLKISRVVDLPVERRGGEPLTGAGPAPLAVRDANITRGGRSLLSAATISVAAGDRLRLAGDAGCGKSTVLDVLAGLRMPASGTVRIDGLDLRRSDLGSVRDQVLLVRGAPFVTGTLLDNLRLGGRAPLSESDLRGLLRLLSLEEAIDQLPQGLDTPVQPSGAPLSESMARRVALARALAARPRVLLLDRALDGLGLPDAPLSRLLDVVLAPEASWTTVVVTDDDRVARRCNQTVQLQDRTLEVVQ